MRPSYGGHRSSRRATSRSIPAGIFGAYDPKRGLCDPGGAVGRAVVDDEILPAETVADGTENRGAGAAGPVRCMRDHNREPPQILCCGLRSGFPRTGFRENPEPARASETDRRPIQI
jgi:hypothetical protein